MPTETTRTVPSTRSQKPWAWCSPRRSWRYWRKGKISRGARFVKKTSRPRTSWTSTRKGKRIGARLGMPLRLRRGKAFRLEEHQEGQAEEEGGVLQADEEVLQEVLVQDEEDLITRHMYTLQSLLTGRTALCVGKHSRAPRSSRSTTAASGTNSASLGRSRRVQGRTIVKISISDKKYASLMLSVILVPVQP